MTFTIIGTGFIMPRHVEAIEDLGGKIIDVVNTAHGEERWKTVVENTRAEWIVILAPNDLHAPIARAGLKKGKKVIVEKPLALNTKDAEEFVGKPVFTVLQLRYHPTLTKLKELVVSAPHLKIEMDIVAPRTEKYYKSWKGDERRSGGILFNIGSHYFDVITHVFGYPEVIKSVRGNKKTMEGVLEGENYVCNWRISTNAPLGKGRRVFRVNGFDFNFSLNDNLAHENLHRQVYKNALAGKGFGAEEVLPSLRLIENINKLREA